MRKFFILLGGVAVAALVVREAEGAVRVVDAGLVPADAFGGFLDVPAQVLSGGAVDEFSDVAAGATSSPVVVSADANLRAFLMMIRHAEGTAGSRGYNTIYSYQYFESFADHPRRRVTANGVTSDAAGAYQFLSSTWDTTVRARIGVTDFSPANQDRGAVALLQYRGAYADVLAGRFDIAVFKCRNEWASLPGNGYGQPQRKLAELKQVYEQAGGAYA